MTSAIVNHRSFWSTTALATAIGVAIGVALTGCGSSGMADEADQADAAAPTTIEFTNLRVEEIAGDRAVIRFETSVPTTCEVEFGTAMTTLDQHATDPDMEPGELALDHNVPLEDLAGETTYYFRARATDTLGTTARSTTLSFTTTLNSDPTATMTNYARISEGTSVVAVSSNWADGTNDSSFGIHNALDGSMTTEWSSGGDGDNAFVMLDLGQMRTLSYFAFRSRMMSDGTSITKQVQRVIDDGATVIGPFATPDHTKRYVFSLDPAINVRTIRVEAVETTGGNTGAKEIQFF